MTSFRSWMRYLAAHFIATDPNPEYSRLDRMDGRRDPE